MVKLRRLKIDRYRNVEPCDLRFSDGLNVVLGQNGAGKTTLLNFVSKVLRASLADTSDPFAIEVELTFPGGTLSGRLATREPTSLATGLEDLGEAAELGRSELTNASQSIVPSFDVTVRRDFRDMTTILRNQHGAIEVRRESSEENRTFSVPEQILVPAFGILLYLITLTRDAGDKDAVDLMPLLLASGQGLRFDEGLDMYRAFVAKAEDSVAFGRDLRPTWSLARKLDQDSWRFGADQGLFPASLRAAIEGHARSADLVSIALPSERVAFLQAFVGLLGLSSGEARFELLRKTTRPKSEHLYFGNLRFWFTRRDGSIFQDHQLSYGQKRLLTFLYYLDANPDFVIADELVNGMHHHWIDECVRAIGDRQAFLTSQNPLLLDYLTFESVDQVRSSFVVCRTELHEGRERMIWRNFTDDEADMFFRAYQVGIEHVGEILRTRGLW